jgi:hypothetical protein
MNTDTILRTFIYDRSLPEIRFISPVKKYTRDPRFSFVLNDSLSKIDNSQLSLFGIIGFYSVSENCKAQSSGHGLHCLFDANLHEGTHHLKISYADSAGNLGSKDYEFIFDRSPPVLFVLDNVTNSDTFEFEIYDALSPISLVEIIDHDNFDFGKNCIEYSKKVKCYMRFDDVNQLSIYTIEARDEAGNVFSQQKMITNDINPPVIKRLEIIESETPVIAFEIEDNFAINTDELSISGVRGFSFHNHCSVLEKIVSCNFNAYEMSKIITLSVEDLAQNKVEKSIISSG